MREWLQLVERNKQIAETARDEGTIAPTIAVHCVAGLGRAPALVAIALIEMGMKPLDAIEFIRGKRRGAFNKPQIAYLVSAYLIMGYKKKGRGECGTKYVLYCRTLINAP